MQAQPRLYGWVPPIRGLRSFTVPNARCPVCRAPVFFYQSTSGGRVFFDELGPPWPKHPCTTLHRSPLPIEPGQARAAESSGRLQQWQKGGWRPLLVRFATPVDSRITCIQGTLDQNLVTFYMRTVGARSGVRLEASSEAVYLVRPMERGRGLAVSLLTPTGTTLLVLGFYAIEDARREGRSAPLSGKRKKASMSSRPGALRKASDRHQSTLVSEGAVQQSSGKKILHVTRRREATVDVSVRGVGVRTISVTYIRRKR